MEIQITCEFCKKKVMISASHVNRAHRNGMNLYCSRECSGLGIRKHKTKAQLVYEKAAYDAEYRAKNRAMLKVKKSAYFQATYDPESARIERKKFAKRHAEYCRQPEYKKWKAEYDRRLRASEYGPFAEAYTVALELQRTVSERMSRYEICSQNGTLKKRQKRRRQSSEAIGRDHSRAVDG
jgi:hypothetical protein